MWLALSNVQMQQRCYKEIGYYETTTILNYTFEKVFYFLFTFLLPIILLIKVNEFNEKYFLGFQAMAIRKIQMLYFLIVILI